MPATAEKKENAQRRTKAAAEAAMALEQIDELLLSLKQLPKRTAKALVEMLENVYRETTHGRDTTLPEKFKWTWCLTDRDATEGIRLFLTSYFNVDFTEVNDL
jgi:hypothetical protein